MKLLDPNLTDAARTSSMGVAGVTYTFLGLPLSDIAALLTAVYMAAQIVILFAPKIKSWWKSWRDK